MKENKYDDSAFFAQYSKMPRSVHGLNAAGEWHALRALLPDMRNARVLDLGCGFGWHCRYAADQGAAAMTGVDLSEKMLAEAKRTTPQPQVAYVRSAIEDFAFPPEAYDVVISSLALHYVRSFGDVCAKVKQTLSPGGTFVFSVEHPIFTAQGPQDWYYDENGNRLHWPVDGYFCEGERSAVFLGEKVTKYHKTLTTYASGLTANGFTLAALVEPEPEPSMLETVPGMADELRRPMMLLLSARA